ncbi:MAG: hypothetical protein H0V17_19035 [Deltaproteobacteria bacterium]|nr:hypothetical protein [Deltaproteobacteria bacterium]
MRNLVLAFLVACGGKNADECRLEAEALAKLLADTPHQPGVFFFPQHEVTLVARTDLKVAPIPDAPVIAIDADAMFFDGNRLDVASELEVALRAAFAKPRTGDQARIYFQIDRRTSWTRVVDAVAAARAAGFTAPAFAFDSGIKLTPPPRNAIDDQLDEIQHGSDASNRATRLAKLASKLVESCKPLAAAYGSVSPSNEDKAEMVIRVIAPSLIECNCNLDMAGFRSLMWRLLAVEPTVQVISFDATTRDETLELPGATTWAEASKRIEVGTKGLKLIAK